MGLGIDLGVNRQLTRAFIDANPVVLSLVPRQRDRRPAGGFEFVELPPRAPQRLTLIETGGVGGIPRPTLTVDGQDRVVEFQLLGEHDAGMARYDVFEHNGKDWEIIELYHENGYERRAMVTSRG